MKKNIAAFTATGPIYPEYISINRTDDGRISISVRGPLRHDSGRGYDVCGDVAEIVISRDELIGLLHEAHDEVYDSHE